jgi:outer membrane receptor for ferrienterochelin and colicin
LYYTFSTGYNAPSLYQLYDATRYYTWDTQFTTGLTRGNRNLDPETSTTNEIGFKQKINNVYLSASYFHTVVENVIEYVYLWDKNVPVNTLGTGFSDDFRGDTYLNAGTMITDGVELGISSKLSDKFIVSGNVMLMNGKLKYSPENIDVSQTGGNHVQMYNAGAFLNKDVKVLGLSRRPSTANLSLTYFPIKVVSLRADLRYVGSRGDVYYESSLGPYGALGTVSVQQYTLLDLSLNFKIWKEVSAGFKVGNITDEKYAEINGFTTKGRSYYLNIRYSL